MSRQYDLVLLGATGYTGKLCAEHITRNLPTNLRWAIAGRNTASLQDLNTKLFDLNSDRLPPHVLTVQLNKKELSELAKKTTVLLNTIGPYHLYSTPVVEACASNGTHYLDVTGETPWVLEIIQKFHETARINGTIIIPEIGIESAPSDLVAFMAVSTIRKVYNCGTRNIVCSLHELKSAGPSGGTLATVLSLLNHYPMSKVIAGTAPFALSPSPPHQRPSQRGLLSRILGPFSFPQLGILTSSITATANVGIVHRSSGLMRDTYGSNFHFEEYMRVSNYLKGVLLHLGLILASVMLVVSPLRALLKRYVYQPGQGPTATNDPDDALEYRAVATADLPGEVEKKVLVQFRYRGGAYYLTGVLLAEGAMVLLEQKDLVRELNGGVLTPACLGDAYIERLRRVGIDISASLLED